MSKMKIFAAILFTFSVQFTSLISAQEFSFGRCGPFPTVKQFDPQRVSPEFSIYESVSIFHPNIVTAALSYAHQLSLFKQRLL